MRRRPWLLFAIPLIFLGIALSFPVQIMLLYGHGFDEMSAVLGKLTFLNWAVVGGLGLCCYWILTASPITLYAVPLLIALVTLNNFFVGYYALDFAPWTAGAATLGFLALTVPLTRGDLMILFLNPQRRWWRAAQRKTVHIPVSLNGVQSLSFKGETFDLSRSGMFVPVQAEAAPKLDQFISICMTLGSISQLRCEGRVVRQSEAKGKYPEGIGIEFSKLTRKQQSDIEKYLNRL